MAKPAKKEKPKYDTLHIYNADGEVREQLKYIAKKHNRSMSSEVQNLIKEAYEEEKANESKGKSKRPRGSLL